jgi:hypothetical protein
MRPPCDPGVPTVEVGDGMDEPLTALEQELADLLRSKDIPVRTFSRL